MFKSTIPFHGFYESLHDDALDRALESIFQDRQTGDPNVDLVYRAMDAVDWGQVHIRYAKEYAENFGREFELKLKFDEMWSPKEYNFTTDQIVVMIERDSVLGLYRKVEDSLRSLFTEACRQRFTHRSGFYSFYSPDWTTWGPIDAWDHHQIGTLVHAWAEHEATNHFDAWAELDLMEQDICNGRLEDWIISAMKPEIWKRLDRIHAYLEDRKERT